MLSPENQKALNEVSAKLGISPRKLYALINFESGFNPKAENPYTHAKGLIQFMPDTARGLGFIDQYDLVNKYPTIASQLRTPVYNYLKRYKPFTGDQSLFMSVFYPAARQWPSYRQFPDYVKKVNPGINTPADYVRKIYLHSGLTYIPPVLILGITGIVLYYYFKHKKKGDIYGSKKIESEGRDE